MKYFVTTFEVAILLLVSCVPTQPVPTLTSQMAATQNPTPTPVADDRIRIAYTPSSEDFANPERGFMKQVSVFPDQTFVPSKLMALQPNDTLIWIYFRLDHYRDRPLDQSGLDTIRSVFTDARNKGLKLVIRFVYNPGPGSTSDPNLANPDAPLDLVLQHINQIKPILVENADVIAVLQAGFVGHWGEWHSSKYLHPLEVRRAILDALLAALPAERMLQLRYPRYREIFFDGTISTQEAFSGTDASRVGLHNDCFLRDQDDGGTYRSSSYQVPKISSPYCDNQNMNACWKEYSAQVGEFTPVGGETCQYNPPRTDCPNALEEMETLHWSFLNSGYRREVLDSWVSDGCIDTIRLRLGYRFTLIESYLPASARPGSEFSFIVRIHNKGFAAMYNPRPVYLVLLGLSNRYEISLPDVDPRRWEPGQEYSLNVDGNLPPDIAPGVYRMGLWLPDAYESLQDYPAYSVRFANTDVWEAATGINILSPTFEILP